MYNLDGTALSAIASLPDLINHGLSALHDTLQQDKHLSIANTSIAIIGPPSDDIENLSQSGAAKRGNFRVWENESVDGILRAWRRSRGEPEDGPSEEKEKDKEGEAGGETEVKAEEAQTVEGSEQAPAGAPAGGEDVEMQE
jgi:20S proteasome subunit alpha 6